MGYGTRVLPRARAAITSAAPPRTDPPLARSGLVTREGGAIIVDTLWDAEYVDVVEDVTLDEGATLTVAAGTTVRFAGYHGLLILDGALVAEGTVEAPVTWTAADPAAYTETQDTTGCWNGITWLNVPAAAEISRLTRCVIEYAKAVPGLGLDPGGSREGGVAAEGVGGALRMVGRSPVEIRACVLRHNCGDRGGALGLHYGASPRIVGTLLIDNAAWTRAGAVYAGYADPRFVHVTMTGNRCLNEETFDRTAAAVDQVHAKPRYAGCIVYGNTTQHHEQHQVLNAKAAYTLYSDIGNFGEGVGGLDEDPCLETHGGVTGRLSATSPCRDAGDLATVAEWVGDYDLVGWPRVSESGIDMGCCEFAEPTSATAPVVAALSLHPNPANPATTLRFTLSRPGAVLLDVLDARGRRVRRLLAGDLPEGDHVRTWRGRDDAGREVASGAYLVRLETPDGVSVSAVSLVR